nr:transcription factor bHLH3 [Flammulina velutipes]WOZ30705.1 transcription factor bHLH3 [Flammulina velutipes]
MVMSLPNSPASDDSTQPLTPTTPTLPLASPTDEQPHSASIGGAGQKRKPSRRANTAERRATHNAVERQRRETLNGRFLDLAALLPNLSQIRRPSKSSIVNSSIAHVHASRRHRLLAARELRALKMESDALRRELNEWRDRAAIPRVEEPVRGEGFGMVISGELEVLGVAGEEEDYDGDEAHSPDEYSGQGYSRSPVIASPTGMSFENPAMQAYEPMMMGPGMGGGMGGNGYYGAAAQAYPYEEKPRFAAQPFDGYPPQRDYNSMLMGGGGAVGAANFAMM